MLGIIQASDFVSVTEKNTRPSISKRAISLLVASTVLVGLSSMSARASDFVTEWSYLQRSAWAYNPALFGGTTDTDGNTCPSTPNNCAVNPLFGSQNISGPWTGQPASIWWNPDGLPSSGEFVSGLTIGKTLTGNIFRPDNNPQIANGGAGPGSFVGGDWTVFIPQGASSADNANKIITQFPGDPMTFTNAALAQKTTHHNEAISIGPTLRTTNLLGELLLHDGTGFLDPLFLIIPSTFVETPNNSSFPDDIFVLGDLIGDGAPMIEGDMITQPFEHMGKSYELLVKLEGVGPLTDEQCAIVLGAGATDCTGIVTFEDTNNSFATQFAIKAVPLPPAGLLFFAALASLGIAARRRKKAA